VCGHPPERLPAAPGSFESRGHLDLSDFVANAVNNLSPGHRAAICQRLHNEEPRKLGTMCSGTDSPVLAYRAVSHALSQLGVQFKFSHEYSCDSSPLVRKFLAQLFNGGMGCLFANVADLAQGQAEAPDALKGMAPSSIPLVDDLIAGFPCTDVSSLLKHAAKNRRADAANYMPYHKQKYKDAYWTCDMWYAACGIRYTVYGIRYTVYGIRYTVYGIQYTVYSKQYSTQYSIQYTVYGIRYTVYGVRYKVYGIRYTVYGIH